MKHSYGYRSYRGESKFRIFLKVLIVILAIVLGVSIAGYFWLQQYVVYSSDGVQMVLPWEQEESTSGQASEQVSEEPTVTPVIEVVVPEEEEPEEVEQPVQAISMSLDAMFNGTVSELLADSGANAAIFDMKLDDGSLAYVSDVELAIEAEASASMAAINTAIHAFHQTEDCYTIARVSCFKDDKLSDAEYGLNILTNSGYRWTDPQGLYWSSPTNEAVQQYLVDICVELAELGFDEILLDNAGYPTEGNLHYIKIGTNYDSSAFATIIDGFYAKVDTALEAYPDVKLSIVTTPSTLEVGSDDLSGQTVTSMIAHGNRIWVEDLGASWTGMVDFLTWEGMESAELNLVSMVDVAGSSTRSWAILD